MDSLDVSPNTRVLALLGVSDPDPAVGYGWFIADSCLFNRLLAGLGKQQTWLMPLNLDSVVEGYGRGLHGNPFRPRRVVYDSTMPLFAIVTVYESDLRAAYLESLRATCRAAARDNDLIHLISIGHGPNEIFGFCIGDSLGDGSSVILLPKDVHDILRNELDGSPVAIILSSCFSGGWLTSDQSVLAAVKEGGESDSYQRSALTVDQGPRPTWVTIPPPRRHRLRTESVAEG